METRIRQLLISRYDAEIEETKKRICSEQVLESEYQGEGPNPHTEYIELLRLSLNELEKWRSKLDIAPTGD